MPESSRPSLLGSAEPCRARPDPACARRLGVLEPCLMSPAAPDVCLGKPEPACARWLGTLEPCLSISSYAEAAVCAW